MKIFATRRRDAHAKTTAVEDDAIATVDGQRLDELLGQFLHNPLT